VKPGDLVDGRFRIDARIGAGGMGVVFRARDEKAGDAPVAIKVLEASSPTRLERARRESATLAQLANPAIVTHVADGLTRDGHVYVAMEWIDGVSVADHLLDAGFSLREAIAVIRQVAGALAAAHRAGIVHRDVKPANILLAGRRLDAVKLIDFGVAWLADATFVLTRSGTAIGTPGYMAPEQARGERQLSPAVDVFGLGCTLYECATGRPAFSGTLRAAVLAKVLYAEPPPLAGRCPEAPVAMVRALERMLDKDPRARLADGDAVVACLDAIGEVVDGPRRRASAPAEQPTATSAITVHRLVMASAGPLDDDGAPPPDEKRTEVQAIASRWYGELTMIAGGAIAIRFAGTSDDVDRRAEGCAADIRGALAGWSVVVSPASPDVGVAIDGGTSELAAVATAALFGRR
jgi:serine/threonine protein kinase